VKLGRWAREKSLGNEDAITERGDQAGKGQVVSCVTAKVMSLIAASPATAGVRGLTPHASLPLQGFSVMRLYATTLFNRLLVEFRDIIPIYEIIDEGFKIIGPSIAVINVIRMLPDIDGQNRRRP
jgi:hypothetical protein